jgi:hypothetical protein
LRDARLEPLTIEPSEHVVAQLSALTAALDQPGTDLQAILSVLIDDLVDAVPGFLGLTITVHHRGPDQRGTVRDGSPTDPPGGTVAAWRFTVADESRPVRSSMQVPLSVLAPAAPGGTVEIYAAAPEAFQALATDARARYGLDGEIVLDRHLRIPSDTAAHDVLIASSAIQQAIGVLLAGGVRPDAALTQLTQVADHERITLAEAAQQVLRRLDLPDEKTPQ